MLDVTLDQVRLFCLANHFLTQKADPAHILKVIDKICGLNTQAARAAYVSLWSRVAGFDRHQYIKIRYHDKSLIKTWLMRGTVHTVTAEDYPLYLSAMRSWSIARRELSERNLAKMGFGLAPAQSSKVTEKVAKLLAAEPMTIAQILPRIQDLLTGMPPAGQKARAKQAVFYLSNRGEICHGQPTGTWYHFKENVFVSVKNWLGGKKITKIDEKDARYHLALRYISGYGPVTAADFAYWTAFKVSDAKRIFADIKDKLVPVTIKDVKGTYWIISQDADTLASIPESTEHPVRFLPQFDPLIMGHKDKLRILNPSYKKQVFLPLSRMNPTILVAGRVAGTWQHKMTDKSFEINHFTDLPPSALKQVNSEGNRLKNWLEG